MAAGAVGLAEVTQALLGFAERRFRGSNVFILALLRDRYPTRDPREFDKIVSREEEFEREFRRKMRDRLRRDIPRALAIPDAKAKEEAVRRILEREKRFTAMREEAMLARAISRMEINLLKELSPEGAYWKLSPYVQEHTLDCLAMGEKFWPWKVLDKIAPPLHAGCPCELWGLDEAIGEGLMSADQVPDPADAVRRAKEITRRVKELEGKLEEASYRAGELSEAKIEHTGAMVALYPSKALAKKLAVKGGEPPEQLHVTLAFLGEAKDIDDKERLKRAVAGFAATAPVISGEISGKGLFTSGPKPVTYASVDLPGLPPIRERLVEALKAGGFPVAEDHGFTPHMTLAYEDVDVEIDAQEIEFESIVLKLGDRRYEYPLAGDVIEEASARQIASIGLDIALTGTGLATDFAPGRGSTSKILAPSRPAIARRLEREPLRWAKGFAKGGQFRPTRGGSSARTIARVLLPTGPPVSPSAKRVRGDGRWTHVRGRYTLVPEAERWEYREGGHVYVSPPGSTNVYRDGRLISEPGSKPLPEERRPHPPTVQASPGTVEAVKSKRAQKRDAAQGLIRDRIAAGKSPVVEGDGATEFLSLPHEGFVMTSATPDGKFVFERGDSILSLNWDGKVITDPAYDATPAPKPLRTSRSAPPESWDAFADDALAWTDELGRRYGVRTNIQMLKPKRSKGDHAATRDWSGRVFVGREAPVDIDAAARAREEGRPLTFQETAGVWSSYWMAAHEISHGVNPINPYLYDDAHANLEEALAEEMSHVLAAERLTEQGQLDVLEWRRKNPAYPSVRGNYREFRHVLATLMDTAGIEEMEERRQFTERLKFRTAPEDRFEEIALAIQKRTGGDLDDLVGRVEFAFANPKLDPWDPSKTRAEIAGGEYRPTLTYEASPGEKQVGWQYGRFLDGTLTDDGTRLVLPDGGTRTVERLPVLWDELKGHTDGAALVAYKPGQKPTEGVTNGDGTPKNFRYVDSVERGKLILRAFAGQGSPGTQVDPSEIKRAAEELRAAKNALTYIEGVPVKRRFDGSFGVGWYDDGRVLSGVAGEENAARIALIRSQQVPPWGVHKGRIELPESPQSPGTTGGLFDDFFDMPDPPNSPGAWLKKLNKIFDEKPPKKPPKKPKKKKQFIGGKKGAKPSDGPIPSYDAVRLELGNSAGGSNGARWAFDKKDRRWLVKTYRGDQDRVASELLANTIYREMGAKVAEAGQMEVGGKPALAYPALEGEVRQYVFQKGGPSEEIGRHYMVDALLANWDYVGMTDDNIMWDPDGNPFRVDQGGTFEFRAMGSSKPFGPVPTEVWTMIGKGQGRRAAKVDEAGMREQAAEIEKVLTPERIDGLVDAAPFADEEMRARVRENLKARVGWMGAFSRGEVELPKPLEGEEAATSLHGTIAKFKLFPEEIDTLFAYAEGMDEEIDEHLRSGKGRDKASKPVRRAVDSLDEMFRQVPKSENDVIAWTGIDIDAPDEGALGEDLVGKTLSEKGFLSASLDANEATRFSLALRLVIPDGSHVLYTQGISDFPSEPDLLLPRGSQLKVTGRRVEGDTVVLDAVVKTQAAYKPVKGPKAKNKPKPKKPDLGFDEAPPKSTFWDDIEGPSAGGQNSPGTVGSWKKQRKGFYVLDGTRYAVASEHALSKSEDADKIATFTGAVEWAVIRFGPDDDVTDSTAGENMDWFDTMKQAKAEAERLAAKDVASV